MSSDNIGGNISIQAEAREVRVVLQLKCQHNKNLKTPKCLVSFCSCIRSAKSESPKSTRLKPFFLPVQSYYCVSVTWLSCQVAIKSIFDTMGIRLFSSFSFHQRPLVSLALAKNVNERKRSVWAMRLPSAASPLSRGLR